MAQQAYIFTELWRQKRRTSWWAEGPNIRSFRSYSLDRNRTKPYSNVTQPVLN
ncbi:Uncharacterized protein TCM_007953 [Theobroma cacao]|uniref:Uncharacterized protein n=1 Tax=Theobroma cacao TaxID=3641 RepID=A0A061E3W3_THECC|nr:Uncharacterized protein TCM_007953 [Theobroma cacao]